MIDLTALGRSLALESGLTLELDMSSAIYIGPDFDRIVYNGTPALRMTFACSDTPGRTAVYVHPDDEAEARELLARLEQSAAGDQE